MSGVEVQIPTHHLQILQMITSGSRQQKSPKEKTERVSEENKNLREQLHPVWEGEPVLNLFLDSSQD